MDSHKVRRLEVVESGRRRRWSAEAKLRIVEESLRGSDSASAVARRHGISPGHLFAWRKMYRDGSLLGSSRGFVAVDFGPAVGSPSTAAEVAPGPGEGRMEVVTANGRRVIVGPDVDASALVRLLTALERS